MHVLREAEGRLRERVETREILSGQLQLERLHVILELRQSPRADNRRGHARLRPQPRECHAGHGALVSFGEDLQLVDERVRFLVERDAGTAISRHLTGVLARVLPAERAALERPPRRDTEAELARHRDKFLLDGTLEQRILDLQPDERRPAAKTRGHVRLSDLPRRRIRHADVAHLTRAHEILERRHRFLNRRVDVPVVEPVEIDVVGLQAAQ